jgi:hypothetical protein
MRLFSRTAIALSVLLLSSVSALGWGLDGHRATGAIADLILQNDPAGDAARDLLGASLSEAATWMGCVKGACHRPLSEDERGFVQSNPQQITFHYTAVPIQQPRYKLGTAGTRSDDVVQVAKQAINVLRGRAPNDGPAVLDRKSALWVLVHLVGELHQPLHVGAIYYGGTCQRIVDPNVVGAGQPNFGIGSTITSTHGGNDLHLTDGKCFHVAYWDEGTVTGAMRLAGIQGTSIPDFGSFIVAHPPAGWETSGEPETWPEQVGDRDHAAREGRANPRSNRSGDVFRKRARPCVLLAGYAEPRLYDLGQPAGACADRQGWIQACGGAAGGFSKSMISGRTLAP